MGQKLTIVVTCTDRKSAQPDPTLMIRNLPPTSTADRVALWRTRLNEGGDRRPLRRLYRGESWTQTLRLETVARRAGFTPRLVVASAGLGFVDADHSASSYAATFALGQPDSVGTSRAENRTWWQALGPTVDSVHQHLESPLLLVLSKSYADAMAPDLIGLADRDDVVVFGGSDVVAKDHRVAANRGLRAALGGTATSLNLRTAIAWLELLPNPALPGNRDHPAWKAWVAEHTHPDDYDRGPMTDAQIRQFVQDLRVAQPSISKSRALRLLRDSGHACEQRRFGSLFDSTLETV